MDANIIIDDLAFLTGFKNNSDFFESYINGMCELQNIGMTRKEAIKMTILQLIHNA